MTWLDEKTINLINIEYDHLSTDYRASEILQDEDFWCLMFKSRDDENKNGVRCALIAKAKGWDK